MTTADRPARLARCLWSLTRQVTRRATLRIIVVDASTLSSNESSGRSVVRDICQATGHAISFIGRREKVAIRLALRTVCEDSLLEFAFRAGASGNRNIILLLTSGENVLFVDDDVVCDVWRSRSHRRAIALGGHIEQRHIAFYARRDEVCETLVPTDVDLPNAHEAVLGRTVRSLATCKALPIDRRLGCTHLKAAARGVRPAQVRMTFSGIAGDAGVTYPDRLLFSNGTWKTALAANRKSFQTALNSREICKIADCYIVMHEVACMAACMGLSNTSIAPPFLPVGRNEDGLFGTTLTATDPRTVGCHLPYAVVHASARAPHYGGERLPSTSETRSADLLISLIRSGAQRIRVKDAHHRLTRLGEWLQSLAALRMPDFVRVTSLATLRTRERELTVIESSLADPDGYPPYWQREFRSYRAMLLKNIHKPSFLLPLEFQDGRTVATGYRDFRKFVQSAGELYIEWPRLWAKARTKLRDVMAVR